MESFIHCIVSDPIQKYTPRAVCANNEFFSRFSLVFTRGFPQPKNTFFIHIYAHTSVLLAICTRGHNIQTKFKYVPLEYLSNTK